MNRSFQFLTVISTCLLLVGIQAMSQEKTLIQRDENKGQTKKELTNEEKVAIWKGEKVVLLGAKEELRQSGSRLYGLYQDGKTTEYLLTEKYAGKSGIILESNFTSGQLKLVITMDGSGEKIYGHSSDHLGFYSELDAAKSLIGKTLWAKGQLTLAKASNGCKSKDTDDRLKINNLQQLIATRAEFGNRLQRVFLMVKTEAGEEGCLDGWDGYDYFDNSNRFRLAPYSVNLNSYTERFYLENPRKLFPAWTNNVWKLIQSGNVAVGMTEDMARMACGSDMRPVGFVLSASNDETSTIYRCNDKKFLVEKGKVTKYVDQ